MNKFARIVFLPLFLAALLSNYAWAANHTGVYKGTAKYVSTTLPACSNAAVVLTITNQCGNLLKGTLKVGAKSFPVIGTFTEYTGGAGYLRLESPYSSGSFAYLYGSFDATGTPIDVSTLEVSSVPTFPADAIFSTFKLVKQ